VLGIFGDDLETKDVPATIAEDTPPKLPISERGSAVQDQMMFFPTRATVEGRGSVAHRFRFPKSFPHLIEQKRLTPIVASLIGTKGFPQFRQKNGSR
jgi:hypothetical protein